RGDEQTILRVQGSWSVRRFRQVAAQDHVGGVRAQANASNLFSVDRVVLIHGSVGPTGDEIRTAVGVEQNAIGAAAGLKAVDHAAGLRIDHHDGIGEAG